MRTAGDYGSSVAASNFNFNSISGDPNQISVNRSIYETKDRVVIALNKSFNTYRSWQTTLGLFLDMHTGQPYTFVFSNDVNNDGFAGNDTFWVPRAPGDVIVRSGLTSGPNALTDAQAEAALFQFINSNKYLRENRGRILPINGGSNPWVNRLDFRLVQEIPTPSWGNFKGKLEFYYDILNVLNLIGRNYGGIKTYGATLNANPSIVSAQVDRATGRYIYTYNPVNSALATPTGTSTSFSAPGAGQANIDARWQMQFGVRYTF